MGVYYNIVVISMKKLEFYNMFYLFLLASVVGWVLEGIWTYFQDGLLLNHSALVLGPFDIAYGICACFLTGALFKYKDCSYLKLFTISFIGGTILEYIMSWGMELVLGFSAWDYSNYFLNINGRVCLLFSTMWGILGVVWIKYIYPLFLKCFAKLKLEGNKKLVKVILIFLVFDLALTISAISRAHNFEKGMPPRNHYEQFLDKTFNKSYLQNMFNNMWE